MNPFDNFDKHRQFVKFAGVDPLASGGIAGGAAARLIRLGRQYKEDNRATDRLRQDREGLMTFKK